MKFRLSFLILILSVTVIAISCRKYLSAKPDASLSTPSTVQDLQAMLDNFPIINRGMQLTHISADEYYLTDTDWGSLTLPYSRDGYKWEAGTEVVEYPDWYGGYAVVYIANTVLDHLPKIKVTNDNIQKINEIKGAALFIRANNLFLVSQLYAKQFDSATAATDLGLPLRLNSDFNEPSVRASVQATYDQILADLHESATLLPVDAGAKTRPGKPAAFALLSRVYLQTGNYLKAKQNADSCLNLYNKLFNYNDLPATVTTSTMVSPFAVFPGNPEMIYYSFVSIPAAIQFQKARVDTVLFKTYESNDIRRAAFFFVSGNNAYYKGSYNPTGTSNNSLFTGIATDEVFLIRAECNARLGNKDLAMGDLNALLEKRIKSPFTKLSAANALDALQQILKERKKELIFRGLRWSDLRRLNKETAFATTIQRKLSGQPIVLPPNSLKYVMLIPQRVIDLSGIQQNPR